MPVEPPPPPAWEPPYGYTVWTGSTYSPGGVAYETTQSCVVTYVSATACWGVNVVTEDG